MTTNDSDMNDVSSQMALDKQTEEKLNIGNGASQVRDHLVAAKTFRTPTLRKDSSAGSPMQLAKHFEKVIEETQKQIMRLLHN